MSSCPFANMLDPNTYADGMPYQELKKARDAGAVVKMDDPITGVPYWLVTRREELDEISKNPTIFSNAEKAPYPMESSEMEIAIHRNTIIGMDPPEHQLVRRIMRNAFTPSAVDAYEPRLREYAKQIVDSVVERGECEFVREVAAELPLISILELLGIPLEDRQQFFDWTNTMMFADDPEMCTSKEEGIAASQKVLEYAYKLAMQHRQQPINDLLEALLNGEVKGRTISEEEFGWIFLLTMVGGNESTRTVIAHGMRLLMEHPEQLQHLVDHPEDIPDACEEMLRYNTAFIAMRRTALQDYELGGQQIKAGDKVILHYHTINHDEDVFGDDAMEFDIHRAKRHKNLYNQLRSFGIGQHFCIGSHLARLELRLMMEEIIPRLRNPKFAAEPTYVKSYFVNAIKEMPITFDKAAG